MPSFRVVGVNTSIALYMLAGVATAPQFMESLGEEMSRRFQQIGSTVQVHSLYPYGDWSRKLRYQLLEARSDLMHPKGGKGVKIRGKWTAGAIRDSYNGGQIVIIGHSAGGIVGLQASSILLEEGMPLHKIVQIGSPKYPVPRNLQPLLLYMFAVNARGRSIDPITRIGRWGGWERNRTLKWKWNSKLNAAENLCPVPIIGGHPDYFRRQEPYVNALGDSNLKITSDIIWKWLGNEGIGDK